jgi:Rieske Fe-S protein
VKSQVKKSKKQVNRRAFLKTLAASGGAAVLASCGSAATPAAGGGDGGGGGTEVTLDLTQPANQSLAAVGGALTLEANAVDSKGLLLYRSSDTAVLAFSRKCTHLGCAVGDFQNGVASCPCHGSQYDTGGKPVKGPAQNPLKEYSTSLSGSTLTIKV